jgi:hypothetical protein
LPTHLVSPSRATSRRLRWHRSSLSSASSGSAFRSISRTCVFKRDGATALDGLPLHIVGPLAPDSQHAAILFVEPIEWSAGQTTGNKVKISFRGGPAVAADVKQGAADLVVSPQPGDVAGDGKTLLMISKIGVAVKAGAPKPDISTPDKLKAALLATTTVGYSQSASGQHFLTALQTPSRARR